MKKVLNWFWRHKMIMGIISILIIGSTYYGYKKFYQDKGVQQKVKTAKVAKGDINIIVTGSGQVHAKNQVDLQPQVAGDGLDVVKVGVENDQEVKKGQIIAVLDSSEAQEKIKSAQLQLRSAQLKLKQAEYQYDTKTYEDKLNRQSQENAVAQQQMELANAYEDLKEYTIKAPFDGIVTGLSVEAGDSISRDEILASVITEELKVIITLNEVDAAKVKMGGEVDLTFDALDDITAIGEVSKVDTIGEVNQGVVSYDVEIDFESPSEYLKPGMSVDAEIKIENKENILMIPSTAIETMQGKNMVMVVIDEASAGKSFEDSSSFKSIEVEIGISDDVYTEIVNGLSSGDVIVTQMQGVNNDSSSSAGSSSNSLIPTMGGGRRPQ